MQCYASKDDEQCVREEHPRNEAHESANGVTWVTPPSFLMANPPNNIFQLFDNGGTIFSVARDGKISFGPNVTPEVAAQAFWKHVGNVATKYQEKITRLQEGVTAALESLEQNEDRDTVTIHLLESTLKAVGTL